MNPVVWTTAVLASLFTPASSDAASFQVVEWRKHDVIKMTGVLEDGDVGRFLTTVTGVEPLRHGYRVLLLDSPGGSVSEALRLSAALKNFNVHTVIPDGAKCASACASIVFIGGALRTMEHFGALGQHSCSRGGVQDAVCNEVLSQHALLNGVSHGSVAAFVTNVPPEEILWFSRADADGWGLSRYAGELESGFEKSEPRVFEILRGKRPGAQSAWRIDFREDAFEAFLRPASDDERELELNIFCDERMKGRLFLSMEVHGPSAVIENAASFVIVSTDIFEWKDENPRIYQYDNLVTEVVTEIPQDHIVDFLQLAQSLNFRIDMKQPYTEVVANTYLDGSRRNLIFAANNCVNSSEGNQ